MLKFNSFILSLMILSSVATINPCNANDLPQMTINEFCGRCVNENIVIIKHKNHFRYVFLNQIFSERGRGLSKIHLDMFARNNKGPCSDMTLEFMGNHGRYGDANTELFYKNISGVVFDIETFPGCENL